jgi:hypothetical protein
MYTSKTIKILGEYSSSGVYEWYTYYVTRRGSPICDKFNIPLMFDSQKDAKRYIYHKKLLRNKNTYIPVEFTKKKPFNFNSTK